MTCEELLDHLAALGLFTEEPPLRTKERLCRRPLPDALRLPAPHRAEVVALPRELFFAPLERLEDATGTCTPLTARPDCGIRFWRPLPRRSRPAPPPPSLDALWVIAPGQNEGARFRDWEAVARKSDPKAELFTQSDKKALLERLAQGTDGLFLIAHGAEGKAGFWLRRGAGTYVGFRELQTALRDMPGKLRFLFAFLCESAQPLYEDLLLPLAEAGKLDGEFGAVLFLDRPKHDWGPEFTRRLLKALASRQAARDPAPFLYALAEARRWLHQHAGREEAATPLAFALRAQAHPWPPQTEREYLTKLLRPLEALNGG